VSNLFSVKNQGNESEVTKYIKDTPTQKTPSSISVKQFNSQISPITNTCIIPVFVGLQSDPTKTGLSVLQTKINEVENLNHALNIVAPSTGSLAKVKDEFSVFLAFAKAQATGETFADQNGDAINFANRWVNV
jgi:hypothetical protein